MVEKEFNLSEERIIIEGMDYPDFIPTKKVKKFLRLLKEGKGVEWDGSFVSISNLRKLVDKLAGDDLI